MQDLNKTTQKSHKKQFANQNTIEALESVVSGLRDSMVNDLGKGTVKGLKDTLIKDLAGGGVNEAWDEILNVNSKAPEKSQKETQGDLSEGAELDLEALQDKSMELTEAGREFRSEIINAGNHADAENSYEVQVKMQEILIEIKKLSESSKELKEQVEIISLEQTGGNMGVYHVNFLEKMLSYVNDLRLNVEDSLACFSSLRSKKAARQYGSMAKKHGTSFTLSGERQVATQVG